MLKIDTLRYTAVDDERHIAVHQDGGNPDGDAYFVIDGPGWRIRYTVRPIYCTGTIARQLMVTEAVNAPMSKTEVLHLVTEIATAIEAASLKCLPENIRVISN